MSVKTVELHTCDSCKALILLGRGGISIASQGAERIAVKWAGGFQDHGTITKGHAPPPFPAPTGASASPFEGIDLKTSVSICRKCLAQRLGFKDDDGPPLDPDDANAPDRFNHREPV